jgi:TRAP-type C4-dicarboxylate transport system substrate-binding protein
MFRGVKLLGIYGHGPGAVFTTDRKVEKIEDFDGLKVRIGGGMQADVAKVLNINAVVKPAPQSYELMSTGVVDGVFFPPESIDSFRLVDIVKNATIFPGGLYADTHGIIMNEQAFAKLSKQDQAIILKLSGEHIARMGGKAWGDADDKAMQAMKAQKVNIIMASDKLVADIKQRTASFEKAWLDEAKAKGIDGPMVLQAYRDELKRVEAGQ